MVNADRSDSTERAYLVDQELVGENRDVILARKPRIGRVPISKARTTHATMRGIVGAFESPAFVGNV